MTDTKSSIVVGTRIPKQDYDKLVDMSKDNYGVTISTLIRIAIEEFIEREVIKNGK